MPFQSDQICPLWRYKSALLVGQWKFFRRHYPKCLWKWLKFRMILNLGFKFYETQNSIRDCHSLPRTLKEITNSHENHLHLCAQERVSFNIQDIQYEVSSLRINIRWLRNLSKNPNKIMCAEASELEIQIHLIQLFDTPHSNSLITYLKFFFYKNKSLSFKC